MLNKKEENRKAVWKKQNYYLLVVTEAEGIANGNQSFNYSPPEQNQKIISNEETNDRGRRTTIGNNLKFN